MLGTSAQVSDVVHGPLVLLAHLSFSHLDLLLLSLQAFNIFVLFSRTSGSISSIFDTKVNVVRMPVFNACKFWLKLDIQINILSLFVHPPLPQTMLFSRGRYLTFRNLFYRTILCLNHSCMDNSCCFEQDGIVNMLSQRLFYKVSWLIDIS